MKELKSKLFSFVKNFTIKEKIIFYLISLVFVVSRIILFVDRDIERVPSFIPIIIIGLIIISLIVSVIVSYFLMLLYSSLRKRITRKNILLLVVLLILSGVFFSYSIFDAHHIGLYLISYKLEEIIRGCNNAFIILIGVILYFFIFNRFLKDIKNDYKTKGLKWIFYPSWAKFVISGPSIFLLPLCMLMGLGAAHGGFSKSDAFILNTIFIFVFIDFIIFILVCLSTVIAFFTGKFRRDNHIDNFNILQLKGEHNLKN